MVPIAYGSYCLLAVQDTVTPNHSASNNSHRTPQQLHVVLTSLQLNVRSEPAGACKTGVGLCKRVACFQICESH